MKKVIALGKRLGLVDNLFDGCRYGLKSCSQDKSHLYLKKGWHFRSNVPAVAACSLIVFVMAKLMILNI